MRFSANGSLSMEYTSVIKNLHKFCFNKMAAHFFIFPHHSEPHFELKTQNFAVNEIQKNASPLFRKTQNVTWILHLQTANPYFLQFQVFLHFLEK